MHVLLVEDDPVTSAMIKRVLKREEFSCDCVDLGEDAIERCKSYNYDIIILDLIMPDIDGFEVLRRLRGAQVYTPVLILSGIVELDSKVEGLRSGADDFLTKPFEQRELIARIDAIFRRSQTLPASTIRVGKLLVNLDARTVTVDDQPVHPAIKEYEILELLCLSIGKPVSKETLLNHLYRGRDEPHLKIIDVFVCKLRKKLEQATGGERYIETVWNQGFVLRERIEIMLSCGVPERSRGIT